ncbi:hypothetical protein FA13DRAFT_1394757 [Coprinellus micaceus]|uniref:Uncharacterized protein n=1 Tax=Coprinellus micaceus TaxID=71717 RepID=A0A4Y7SQG8_COPMI|nr:hypothetical protein FA13DRAFT_1394757 [Coprinellus micaceus]
MSQYDSQILSKGYPFPSSIPPESMEAPELERQVHICDRVSQKWAGLAEGQYAYPRDGTQFVLGQRVQDLRIRSKAGVEVKIRSVHFLNVPGRDLMLVHYKDDWSVLEVWDLERKGVKGSGAKKVAEWGPRGTIVKNVVVDGNGDGESGVRIAVGVLVPPEEHLVQVLTLTPSLSFEITASVRTFMSPIAFQGNLLGLGDHLSQSPLWNWKASTFASLDGELAPNRENHTTLSPEAEGDEIGTMNPIVDMVFAQDYVFVARAYTLTLFSIPKEFHATLDRAMEDSVGFLAKHSFGCVDAVCVTPVAPRNGAATVTPSYHILVRGFSNDSWKEWNSHTLQLYALDPASPAPLASSSVPYLFPPRLEASVATRYGRLNCSRVFLGKAGVALWVQPKRSGMRFQEEEYYGIDHYVDSPHIQLSDHRDAPRLNAAILVDSPYRFDDGSGEMSTGFMEETDGEAAELDPILVMANHDGDADWTCMDWDEAGGRIVLGLESGWVTLIEM